ncbi:MAG TPA: phosphoribosyltransferase family protein [Mycobacteriales bacterium]
MFADRTDAGRRLGDRLAARLAPMAPDDGVVLGLPRGGVVVAAAVARVLGLPLDAVVVRKLGLPWHPELAMGAIAGDVIVRNERVLAETEVDPAEVEEVIRTEQVELARREAAYRQGRPPVRVEGLVAIVVDDGYATGATARAALMAVRSRGPARLVLAVPVAPAHADVRDVADDLVALARPEPFGAVGRYYRDFSPTTDAEVVALLSSEEPST